MQRLDNVRNYVALQSDRYQMLNSFNRLASKIGIGVFIVQIIAFAIVSFFYINRFNNEVDQRLIDRLSIPGTLMNNGDLDFNSISDENLMQQLVGESLTEGLIVGTNNNIFFSLHPELVGSSISELSNINQSLFSPELAESVIIRDGDQIAIITPIFASDRVTVRFFAYIQATTITSTAQQQEIATLFLVSLLLTLIVTSTVFLVTVDRIMLKRISNLSDVAYQIQSGILSARAGEGSRDELGKFAQSFNHMASQLEQTLSGLESIVAERTKELQAARQEAENAKDIAVKANDLKSRFLANMSHELRTPLNAIINMSGFIVDGYLGEINNQQRENLNIVIDSSEHLLSLINDVLDITRIEAGMMQVIFEWFPLEPVIQSVLTSGYGLLKDSTVELRQNLPDQPLPNMLGDKRRVRQILLNIISNATKYTIEGEIVFTCEMRDDAILFSVQDTGIGIAQEDYKYVFQTFSQAKNSLGNIASSGLGLPITKQLIAIHSGDIWFESVLGQGSTFYVELPIEAPVIEGIVVLESELRS